MSEATTRQTTTTGTPAAAVDAGQPGARSLPWVGSAGRDREHRRLGSERSVMLRLSEEELSDVAGAARLTGLTPSGYAAEATLAASRALAGPGGNPAQAALAELISARVDVRRVSTDLSGLLSSTPPGARAPQETVDVRGVVDAALRAVARVDEAAAALARVAR